MFRTPTVAAIVSVTLLAAGCTQPTTPATGGSASVPAATAATSSAPSTPVVVAPATAEELAQKTQAALKAATSVTMKGAFTSDGQDTSFDASGRLDGSNYRMTLSQGGATFHLNMVDGVLYVKADEVFWAQAGSDAKSAQYKGKWVKVNKALGATLKEMTPGFLLESMSENFTAEKLAPEVTEGTVDGVAVFIVSNAKGASSGQFSIAADGSWLPLKYETTSQDSPGAMTFSEWNSAPVVEAPPAAEVVEMP